MNVIIRGNAIGKQARDFTVHQPPHLNVQFALCACTLMHKPSARKPPALYLPRP